MVEMTDLMYEVSVDVLRERKRQNSKWGKQRHNAGKWLAILMEEVGEVAEASQKSLGLTTMKETDASDLYEEIIQASAVLNAWAEQIKEEADAK